MLKGGLVNINPSCAVGKRAVFYKIRSALRRRNMDHVKMYPLCFVLVFFSETGETSPFARAIDFVQPDKEIKLNMSSFDPFFNRFLIFFTTDIPFSPPPLLNI